MILSQLKAPPSPFLHGEGNDGDTLKKTHSTNADTHTRTGIHPYEHTHAHPTPMSTFERLSRLDLEIHEVGHQECLAINADVASH
jgi:hypothetical protein